MKKSIDIIQNITKKIRLISIRTRKKMNHVVAGNNTTKLLGQGLAFDQMREYQHGDDVRLIDWKAYARTQTLITKQYTEERQKKIFILCDMSRSSLVDTGVMSKAEVSKTALSVLMITAAYRNDQVSSILYADKVILSTPLTNTIAGVSKSLEDVFACKNDFLGTRLHYAARELLKRQKKNPATVFIISDFIDDTVQQEVSLLASLYDVYAIRIVDPIELQLPSVGMLNITDIESGEEYTIDTNLRETIIKMLREKIEHQNTFFKRSGIAVLELRSDDKNIIDTMIQFFKKMEKR